MKFKIKCVCLEKVTPLVISRGPITQGLNIFLQIFDGEHSGVGETVMPSEASPQNAAKLMQDISNFLEKIDILSPIKLWELSRRADLPAIAIMIIDSAAWDLLAKKANMPLYQLLGLEKKDIKTSITVSIGKPDWVYERAKHLIKTFNPYFLKIKLGSNNGIEADQASFSAVKQAMLDMGQEKHTQLFVDANGGWDLKGAKHMLQWLHTHGAIYVEQPLKKGEESFLPELYQDRPLPIYVDESIHFVGDMPQILHCVDGVNLKLNKSGGITEALRIHNIARCFNLKCMVGCFSESPHAIATALSIGSLFDYVDLDSFLNLKECDKVSKDNQLTYQNGYLIQSNKPGIGVINAI